jgi:hypothetical protein
VFIDQFVSLASKNDTEIVKTVDDPFEFATGGQLHNDMAPIPPDPVEKLILYIDLILQHIFSPPLSKKALTSENIFSRLEDMSRQQTVLSALNHVHCLLA